MTQLDELFIKINDQGRPSKKNISTFWDIYAFEYALVDNVLAFTLSIANIVPRVSKLKLKVSWSKASNASSPVLKITQSIDDTKYRK